MVHQEIKRTKPHAAGHLKSRVLFFLPTIGGYVDRVRLMMEVSRSLDECVLLVGREDIDLDTTEFTGFRVVDVGFRKGLRPYNMLQASRIAESLIRHAGVNVVHDTFGTLYPLFRKKARYPDVSFLTSVFGPVGWRLRHVFNQFSAARLLSTKSTAVMLPNQWIENLICKNSDRVVVQAPGLTMRLLETVDIPHSRVSVLTNSVDTDFWCPDPAGSRPQTRDGCVILFVGGLDHSRGIFTMLEVVRSLHEKGTAARLKLVGGWGPFAKKLALERIESYGIGPEIEIVPKTSRERLREMYREADLFLYQTINDGSPRVVLEAVACGLPVIASHHPGIDVIDPDGDFIAFNDFGDTERIVIHVRDLIQRPRRRLQMVERGRQSAINRFSASVVARRYVELYAEITGASAS
ncbi:MAG: glycosyltransferase family 4 protein [Chloroflexi bacterium]|nr:glycosyltransferase family 4 protein [Chloroflexota bacterium]